MIFRPLAYETVDWPSLDLYSDRCIFQTREWLEFVADSQEAQPIIGEFIERGQPVGVFTGLIVKKFGLKILGSPFVGWTTDYLGFNLLPGVNRGTALQCLERFAFNELGCAHLELRDRWLDSGDALNLGFERSGGKTYEVDLSGNLNDIFAAFHTNARRYVRKSERDGVIIEEARDPQFAEDYYAQLRDVFAKQSLVPTYDLKRVRLLYQHVYPTGRLLLLRARDKDKHCIATGIFPALNDTMYFWGGASWRHSQYLHPNDPIQWYAIQFWKQRGITRYDMAGSGSYKIKYGGAAICVPWLRKSKYLIVGRMRNVAKRLYRLKQRWRAKYVS